MVAGFGYYLVTGVRNDGRALALRPVRPVLEPVVGAGLRRKYFGIDFVSLTTLTNQQIKELYSWHSFIVFSVRILYYGFS